MILIIIITVYILERQVMCVVWIKKSTQFEHGNTLNQEENFKSLE